MLSTPHGRLGTTNSERCKQAKRNFQLHTVDQELLMSLKESTKKSITFNSTRQIRNQKTKRKRYALNVLLSTPHGRLGTFSHPKQNVRLVSLSTPHGRLGTDKRCLSLTLPLMTFNSTRQIRNQELSESLLHLKTPFNSTRQIRNPN